MKKSLKQDETSSEAMAELGRHPQDHHTHRSATEVTTPGGDSTPAHPRPLPPRSLPPRPLSARTLGSVLFPK